MTAKPEYRISICSCGHICIDEECSPPVFLFEEHILCCECLPADHRRWVTCISHRELRDAK